MNVTAPRREWPTERQVVLIAAAAALLAFVPSLWAGFVFDDQPLIVRNPFAHRIAGVGRCFSTYFWDLGDVRADEALHYYRPLVCASYVANWVLSKGAAWTFHAINVLGHVMATILAARFALRWVTRNDLALAAALVFALHPARTENVIWVAGRTDVFMALFGFGATELTHIAATSRRHRALAAAGAILCMVLALLSKEPSVVFCGFCWAEVIRNRERFAASKTSLVAPIGVSVVTAVYLFVRSFYRVGGPPFRFTPLHGLFTIGAYIERTIFPWPQTFYFQPLTQTDHQIEIPLLPAALGVVGIVVLVALSIHALRRGPASFFLALSPALFVLPILHFFPTGLRTSTSDRFLYMPAFLAALCLFHLFEARAGPLLSERPARLAIGGIALTWLFVDVLRTPDYANDLALWSHELALLPSNPHALRVVAPHLATQGDVGGALKLYKRSLSPSSYRYVLIDVANDRLKTYVNVVALAAAHTADGDVERLTRLFGELRAVADQRPELLVGRTAGIELKPRPTPEIMKRVMEGRGRVTVRAEAAFVAARTGHDAEARRWLAAIPDEDLANVWNAPNLVLSYARLFDFPEARRRLSVLGDVVEKDVGTDLTRRIDAAEAWLERARRGGIDPALANALAHAELGSYLRALRALRPVLQRPNVPAGTVQLYIDLLVSARLEDEARREATSHFGDTRGRQMVDSMLQQLNPRLKELEVVSSAAWREHAAP